MIARLLGLLGVAATRAAHRLGHHAYLSTGCLHGDHAYCRTQARRYDGTTKNPHQCKFCGDTQADDGWCVCRCHRKPAHRKDHDRA